MVPVSVVIMTKDESAILGKTLQSVGGLTDDIVIVDNGSTDGTVSIARSFGCRVIETEWLGYGLTKNKGIDTAKYDWILSLDADECPDATLLQAISHINFSETGVAYDLDFKTYFGNKRIKFGEWGVDHHIRLVNRQRIRWTDDKVHEQLRVPDDIQRR
ncbi:MAG: glycosyltransferase family 2 protein [Chitinophagaceae bacterium]|nr:glycosyltransferase family 2 protein [Chitinophagaceae bacterium]